MATKVLLGCYCSAFLLSATLLFSVQPMVAKMVLPLYGGSSAVWTTCMLFFQATLLAGYGYAHLATVCLPVRRQMLLHTVLILLPVLLLPLAVPRDWITSQNANPAFSLLLLLLIVVGGPLLVVSTTAPLMQRWFAETDHPHAHDPYFLYAVSNFGSMVALLGYPVIVEPLLRLSQQAGWWSRGYMLLVALIGASAVLTLISSKNADSTTAQPSTGNNRSEGNDNKIVSNEIGWRERGWWVLLSFVPSSWLLAVTARLTTDIAPMPLLWVVPLALYLLTFILVFARRQLLPHTWMVRLFPFTIVVLVASVIVTSASSRVLLMTIHLAAFFVGTMVCHGELVRRRPPVGQLTQFYLWMSFGGALGGVFNAIIAPLVFPVLLEFPLIVTLACLLHRGREPNMQRSWDLGLLVATTLLVGILMNWFEVGASPTMVLFVISAVPLLILFYVIRRPQWFAAAAAVVFLWEQFDAGPNERIIHLARSFYGAHRVTVDRPGNDPDSGEPLRQYRRLMHGTTLHGIQDIAADRICVPLTYYHRTGPLGQLLDAFQPEDSGEQQIAVIGLGTGAMACYSSPQRRFTFYEIDPDVRRIAESPQYFTYLTNCGGHQNEVIVGDGRQEIATAPDQHYSLIILDAFSSDSVPTHLLTVEAIELYLKKLPPNGVIGFHVSNRHLDLAQVLGDNAAHIGLVALVCSDVHLTDDDYRNGKAPSTYVALARSRSDFKTLADRPNWKPLLPRANPQPWTDDYSNILSVLSWSALRPRH